jgi:hypothetical protein
MANTASTYRLIVIGADLTGVTGHHTIHTRIEETAADGETLLGVPDTFGIEIVALERRFGGDIEKWRDWVGATMLKRHQNRMSVQTKVLDWQGQKFDVSAAASTFTAPASLGPPVPPPVPPPAPPAPENSR